MSKKRGQRLKVFSYLTGTILLSSTIATTLLSATSCSSTSSPSNNKPSGGNFQAHLQNIVKIDTQTVRPKKQTLTKTEFDNLNQSNYKDSLYFSPEIKYQDLLQVIEFKKSNDTISFKFGYTIEDKKISSKPLQFTYKIIDDHVTPDPGFDYQPYIDNLNNVNNSTVTPKKNPLTTSEFNNITQSNYKDNIIISPTIKYQEKITVTYFNKTGNSIAFKLGYIINDRQLESNEVSISYTIDDPKPIEPEFDFKPYIDNLKKINSTTVSAKQSVLTTEQFNALEQSNYKEQLNISSDIEHQDLLEVTYFEKSSNNIRFKLGYTIHGKKLESEIIELAYTIQNIEPPKPEINYSFSVTSGTKQNIVSSNSANYHWTLSADKEVTQAFSVSVKLSNNKFYNGTTSRIDGTNTYNLEVNFNDLNPNTKYIVQSIDVSIGDKKFNAFTNNSDTYHFTTLKTNDSIIKLTLANTQVIAPNNKLGVSIELDQLLQKNVDKKLRLKFQNKTTSQFIYSNEINLLANTLTYSSEIINLSVAGVYQYIGAEINDGSVWNTFNSALTTSNPEFEYKAKENTTGLPYSSKALTEYGNCYRLQVADKLVNADSSNVKTYTSDALTPDSLKAKRNSYRLYFDKLANLPETPKQHDTINKSLKQSNEYNISTVLIEGNKVRVLLKGNTDISTLSLMVKSWDNYNPWEKLITLNKEPSGTVWWFDISNLNINQNKFIITDMVVNDEFHTALDYYDKLIINRTETPTLKVDNFEVYKDNNNKNAYGTLSLNWNDDDLNKLYNKVFALDFSIEQLEWKKYDPFGGITNWEDEYNTQYAPPTTKRIYVPFNQLSKFSLDGFQDGLNYTLTNIEIMNDISYLPYMNPITVDKNNNYKFAFIYDWVNNLQLIDQLHQDSVPKQITKQELMKEASTVEKEYQIDYSLNNMNTLLDYNFNLYNRTTRYPKAKDKIVNNTKYVLMKNGVKQSLNYFMPSEILEKTIFDIDASKHQATVTKNLNSIVGLTPDKYDDTILWLTFELDINPRRNLDYVEFNDIHSRIRVPVALKNLKQYKHIQDVDFMFDNIQGTPEYQQKLFSKIKKNVMFNLDINDANELTLTVVSRNNNVSFTNDMWSLNTSSERSAMLGTCNMFVNWVQDETNKTPILSYQEASQVDDLTIKGTMTSYNNTYELKVSEAGEKDSNDKSMTNYRLLPEPNKDNITKRLFKQQTSTGIEAARMRTFGINDKAGGTWNCLGKINDDPNDYRFYAMINYHVWSTMGDPDNIGKNVTDDRGYKYVEVDNPSITAPTLVDENEPNKKQPIYNTGETKLEPQGYKMQLTTKPNEGIKIKLFQSCFNGDKLGKMPSYDAFRNNEGFTEAKNKDNNLDMVLAVIDLRCAIEPFKGQKIEEATYNGRPLTALEKGAVQHFQNLMKVPPIEFSNLSKHMSSVANYNYYVASMPTSEAVTNPISAPAKRYREYLIGNNSAKIVLLSTLNDSSLEDKHASNRPLFVLQNRYNDIQNGSSGTGVYDSQGRVVGIDVRGHISSSSFWFFIDTQKYSYLGGNDDSPYNPDTFYKRVKKMSYLYPNTYKDIFSK